MSDVSKLVGQLQSMRVRELSKSRKTGETCLICGHVDHSCACLQELRKAQKELKKDDDMGGEPMEMSELCKSCGKKHALKKCGEIKTKGKMEKADVPTASAPTKAPTAAGSTSKGGSPKIGGMPSGPKMTAAPKVMKSELKKAAGPRLGGKDQMSQDMTSHAISAAPKVSLPAVSSTPKAPVDHAARHATFTDFTPAGAFSAGAGATAGAIKAPNVSTKPMVAMGTAAAPAAGLLDRFRTALKGNASK